jgi:hypothetical protein
MILNNKIIRKTPLIFSLSEWKISVSQRFVKDYGVNLEIGN